MRECDAAKHHAMATRNAGSVDTSL